MNIRISKSDYASLLTLIDRCTAIVQQSQPTLRDYNAARRLKLIRKKIERTNIKNIEYGEKDK